MAHRIALLAYPGFELLDVAGPASVFAQANRLLQTSGKAAFYDVEIVSPAGGLVPANGGVALESRALGKTPADKVDTLLIVGAYEESLFAAMADPVLRRWVPNCARRATRFGSICSGAFVLADLGLVDGKCVATHWYDAAALAKSYPSVVVDPERLYVVDGNVWTSAGVSTAIDMALAMVSHDIGAGIAGLIAKRLVLYVRRPGYQSQFSPLLQAQAKADDPFAGLIAWLQANLHRPLDVPRLAARAGLTERSFYRKFAAATGKSPARFVEMIRLDAARMLLGQKLPLKAVAAQVGLSSAAKLAKAFERRFGLPPRLFRAMHTV